MSEVYNNLHVEQFCVVPTETLIGHLLVNAGKPNSGFFFTPLGPCDTFLWTAHSQNAMGLAHRALFGPHSVSPTVQVCVYEIVQISA